MDKDMFDELMKSVQEMDRIVKGLSVDEDELSDYEFDDEYDDDDDDDVETSNSCIE
jgi:hypothetical protein